MQLSIFIKELTALSIFFVGAYLSLIIF